VSVCERVLVCVCVCARARVRARAHVCGIKGQVFEGSILKSNTMMVYERVCVREREGE